MAAEGLDQLLLELGIDMSPMAKAVAGVKLVLDDLNSLSSEAEQKTAQATSQQTALSREQKTTSEQAVAAALQALEQNLKNVGALQQQTGELQSQVAAYKDLLVEDMQRNESLEKQLGTLTKQSEALRVQVAQYKQLASEHSKAAKEGGEGIGGTIRNVGAKTAGSLLGGGILGEVATGVIAGQGISVAVEGIGKLIEKMKEMQDEASQMTLIQNQFERIAQAAGIDATAAINKMRVATDGLVDKMTLMRTATAALKSPFGISLDQVSQLEGAVVRLAEANKHTAAEGIESLNRALTSGRTQQLMYVTGLSRIASQLDNVSSSAGKVERGSLQMNKAMGMIIAQSEAMGELPQTLEQMMTRLDVAFKDLSREFGRGFNLSAGAQTAITIFQHLTEEIVGAGATAETLGQKVGNAFSVLAVGVQAAIPVVKELWTTLKDVSGIAFDSLFGGITSISDAGNDVEKSFKVVHPVLFDVVKGLLSINLQFESLLINLNSILDWVKDHVPGGGLLGGLIGLRGAQAGGALAAGMAGAEEGSALGPIGTAAGAAAGFTVGSAYDTYKKKGWKGVGRMFTPNHPSYDDEDQSQDQDKPASSGPAKPSREAQLDAAQKHMQSILDDYITQYNKSEAALKKAPTGITPPKATDQEKLSELRKAETLKLKLLEEQARLELQQKKDLIAAEKAIDDAAYAAGEESLKDHLTKERALADASYNAEREEAQQTLAAKQTDISDRYKGLRGQQGAAIPQLNKDEALEQANAQTAYNLSIEKAEAAHQLKLNSIRREGAKADQDALKETIAKNLQLYEQQNRDALKAAEDANKAQAALTEKQHKEGLASPDEYRSQRLQEVQELAQAQIKAATDVAAAQRKAAEDTYAAAPKSPQADVTRQAAIDKADETFKAAVATTIDQTKQQIETLTDATAALQEKLDIAQKRFTETQGVYQSQLQEDKQQNNGAGQVSIMQKINSSLAQQQTQLGQLLNAATPYSNVWYSIGNDMENVYKQQVQINNELDAANDKAAIYGQMYASLGQGIAANFHSKFAQGLASDVGAGAKSLEDSTKLGKIIGGDKKVQKTPEQQAFETNMQSAATSTKALVDPLSQLQQAVAATIAWFNKLTALQPNVPQGAGTDAGGDTNDDDGGDTDAGEGPADGGDTDAGDGSSSDSGDGDDGLSQFASKLGASITAIDNFTASILNAHSAISGAAGGAAGGAGMGSTIQTALGASGPWGPLLGAGVGAITGAITGAKNAAVTKNITDMQAQYTQIMNQFAANTNNLQQTIVSLAGLMAQAQAMQASSKKGGAQYQQLITQYQQQLVQLQNQQRQTMIQMREQVAILSAPVGAQGFLSTLQQIIQQYQQFEGAAQNATDLAQANQFLVESLQQYENNLQTQLLQDNTQAINDAIQLNDLLYQRSQDILNFNNQVQGILTQGILTRTPTRAQTIGEQVQQLTVQHNLEMENINEQVAAAQYRVAQEQQIFGLATDRVSLEMQLLQAQNAQTNLDMQRIAALAALVQVMTGGDITSGPLGQLISSFPGVSNDAAGGLPDLLTSLATALSAAGPGTAAANKPVTGNTPGANQGGSSGLDALFTAAYNNYASMGFAGYRATNL